MTEYNLNDDNLIALSYIEAIIKEDEQQATLIQQNVRAEALHKGLLITASSLVVAISGIWNISIEETINKLRTANKGKDNRPNTT